MDYPSLYRSSGLEPFRRMAQLQREFDRIFGDAQSNGGSSLANFENPSCDVEESEDHYLMALDLPGMKKEDIKIELHDGNLRIWGERSRESEEKKKGIYRSERFYGSFERSFRLPYDVKAEDIQTEYKDGVLRLAVPKSAAAPSKQIKIGDSKPGFFDRLLKKDGQGDKGKQIGKQHSERVA
jgi:HSP20 family protein